MEPQWSKLQLALAKELPEKALEFGADLAGLAAVQDVISCPSERLFPQMKDHTRDHFAQRITTGLPHGAVKWDAEEKTLLVFAVSHPEEQPSLDWWYGESTPTGNRILARIAAELESYLADKYPQIKVWKKPYHVEKGGIYLKDAAIAAGLGRIGKNNLLITPQFGPRVRLRAMGINIDLPPSPPMQEDPCRGCPMPCRAACPQKAFGAPIYTAAETALPLLPGRDGAYSRLLCALEMERNESAVVPFSDACGSALPVVKYCRACEFACRAGNKLLK